MYFVKKNGKNMTFTGKQRQNHMVLHRPSVATCSDPSAAVTWAVSPAIATWADPSAAVIWAVSQSVATWADPPAAGTWAVPPAIADLLVKCIKLSISNNREKRLSEQYKKTSVADPDPGSGAFLTP